MQFLCSGLDKEKTHARVPLPSVYRSCASARLQTDSELASRDHLLGSTAIHVSLIEHDIRSHVRWPGSQHLLLAVHQIAGVKRGQLEAVAMCNRIGGAGLYAVAAENAAIVVDVVDLSVAFGAAHALFRGVIGSFDIDAIRRTI